MTRPSASEAPVSSDSLLSSAAGDSVPVQNRGTRHPSLLTPAARKAILQRMLLFRQASLDQVSHLTGASHAELRRYRHDIVESNLPELLLQRGAGLPFTRELPQGVLLYLLVRALRPRHAVETGIRPGYSTAWILAGLDANGSGELTSLGPGTTAGRASSVSNVSVGQFVAPALRTRWTLVLGNSEERLRDVLSGSHSVDLFFYDNGPDAHRARFELRSAWAALSDRGVLLAHHIEANPAWGEFCRAQGLPEQVLDPGPPPLGALGMQHAHR